MRKTPQPLLQVRLLHAGRVANWHGRAAWSAQDAHRDVRLCPPALLPSMLHGNLLNRRLVARRSQRASTRGWGVLDCMSLLATFGRNPRRSATSGHLAQVPRAEYRMTVKIWKRASRLAAGERTSRGSETEQKINVAVGAGSVRPGQSTPMAPAPAPESFWAC